LSTGGFDFHFNLKADVNIVHACLDGVDDPMESSQLLVALQSAVVAHSAESGKIRAVVLTNPGNPSGRCYPRESLEIVAQFCQSHDLYLIIDEVYALSQPCMTSPGEPGFISALSLDLEAINVELARLVVIWCTSKDFGSSGIRMVRKQ
jgi:aspartate/methionine/tyrosine aminotransferase